MLTGSAETLEGERRDVRSSRILSIMGRLRLNTVRQIPRRPSPPTRPTVPGREAIYLGGGGGEGEEGSDERKVVSYSGGRYAAVAPPKLTSTTFEYMS